jgi:outer membrane translocation and assembly module TamA
MGLTIRICASTTATVLVAGTLLLTTIASPGRAAAQERAAAAQSGSPSTESRHERWRRLRLAKRQNLRPYRQPFWERYLYSIDQKGSQSIEDFNLYGFYPRLDFIARGSGPAVGLRYWRPNVKGPLDLMGSAFYSVRRYQHVDLHAGLIPNRGKRIPSASFMEEDLDDLGDIDRTRFSHFKLYASGRYRYRPEERYYGSGPDSRREDQRRFLLRDMLFEITTGYQFTSKIDWTVKAGYLQHSLGLKDLADLEDELTGARNPPNYFRLRSTVLFDYRDDPGIPHSGFSLTLGWELYENVTQPDRHNFHRYGLDARGYIPLGSHQRVLALRSIFLDSIPESGNEVPFFLQPSLGGGESLRGYDSYRFRGEKLMMYQAEYRWEASKRWEFALFGDTGTVSDGAGRLSFGKMRSDLGIGVRFKSSRSTIFRVDQAWGSEGAKTQFRVSAVF